MVGLEKTIYTVSEDDGMVEVCVVVTSECNIPFPFNVNVLTRRGSGMYVHARHIYRCHVTLYSLPS